MAIWSDWGLPGPVSSRGVCSRCSGLKGSLSLQLVPVGSSGMKVAKWPTGAWLRWEVCHSPRDRCRKGLPCSEPTLKALDYLALFGSCLTARARGRQGRTEPGAAARCSYSSWRGLTSSAETTLSLTYLVIALLYCFLLTHCEWEVDSKERLVRSVLPSSADRLPLLQGNISQQQLPAAYGGDDDLSVTHRTLLTSSLLMIKKKEKKIPFSWSYKCERSLLLK